MAKYNFTKQNNQLLITLVPNTNEVEPRTYSFKKARIISGVKKIKFYEGRFFVKSFIFSEISEIGGEIPTSLENAVELILNLGNLPSVNFDITADWANIPDYPVTDQASFELFLSERGYNLDNNLINIQIQNFTLLNNNLKCNLNASGTVLELGGINAVKVNSIGNIENLSILNVGENELTEFRPTSSLPISLETIGVSNNLITTLGYSNSESWANLQTEFTTTCIVDFSNNTNSVTGTNLEAILISKNCNVIA